VSEALDIERGTAGLDGDDGVAERRKRIAAVDARGIIATPANSRYNELVCQAARLSILNDGHDVEIHHEPPGVAFR